MWFISWMNSWWSNAAATWSTSVGGWEPLETAKTNGFPKVLGMEILIRYEIHVWVLKFSDLMVSMKIMHKGKLQVYIYIHTYTIIIHLWTHQGPHWASQRSTSLAKNKMSCAPVDTAHAETVGNRQNHIGNIRKPYFKGSFSQTIGLTWFNPFLKL